MYIFFKKFYDRNKIASFNKIYWDCFYNILIISDNMKKDVGKH